MKYIRTKDGRIIEVMSGPDENEWYEQKDGITCLPKKKILKQADTIEELIQIGDIVFYWSSSDDKEHCYLMVCDTEITIIRNEPITKLLVPVGEDYKCIAKGYPSFNLIKNKRYLVNKGELELL